MRTRRADSIIDYDSINDYCSWEFLTAFLANWTDIILPDESWADLNYTTGCSVPFQIVFPAAEHWRRILAMSAAWHGGFVYAVVQSTSRQNVGWAMRSLELLLRRRCGSGLIMTIRTLRAWRRERQRRVHVELQVCARHGRLD
ncbi:hypothetical protein BDV98DRAFT_343199 [Pterulicium gracile]|uniref:Uncharacterized protein n=1 Tax=Pterulicium gracile TaxID=1884261 RepID=A0A5C3Q220_9AGAR|nr:hypothetical protein BDV98DRAFT_343199 [Pterula gracilis]